MYCDFKLSVLHWQALWKTCFVVKIKKVNLRNQLDTDKNNNFSSEVSHSWNLEFRPSKLEWFFCILRNYFSLAGKTGPIFLGYLNAKCMCLDHWVLTVVLYMPVSTVLLYVLGYILGMCHCEGYGFQAVQSGIGYRFGLE